jgi:hypothetical protein
MMDVVTGREPPPGNGHAPPVIPDGMIIAPAAPLRVPWGGHLKHSAKFLLTLFAYASFSMMARDASAGLLILGNFIGGEQKGGSFGGGNIIDIFDAAAAAWEGVVLDDFVLRLDYGWGPDPGGLHVLVAQGGIPNRETHGLILVNPQIYNDGSFTTLYMDPTPSDNDEFTAYQETFEDFGGGLLNTSRVFFSDTMGTSFQYLDLYTILSHEIGHALGISNANISFVAESADGDIDVTDSQPFAGSSLPLATNNFGVTSHLDISGPVMAGLFPNARQLLSDADIVATAQLSEWNTTLSPVAVPEPATLWLVGCGIVAVVGTERQRRKRQRID